MNNQLTKPRSRDNYFRCRICKTLNKDEESLRDPITGAFICKNLCKPEYSQPEYESPLQYD